MLWGAVDCPVPPRLLQRKTPSFQMQRHGLGTCRGGVAMQCDPGDTGCPMGTGKRCLPTPRARCCLERPGGAVGQGRAATVSLSCSAPLPLHLPCGPLFFSLLGMWPHVSCLWHTNFIVAVWLFVCQLDGFFHVCPAWCPAGGEGLLCAPLREVLVPLTLQTFAGKHFQELSRHAKPDGQTSEHLNTCHRSLSAQKSVSHLGAPWCCGRAYSVAACHSGTGYGTARQLKCHWGMQGL